ncbi:CsbD family protein [Caenibius sp. WL]|uniref:CsbD family protein n=1 Tax=Caenibius sp. WL TaxID=2872646 RepID=UPI001C9A0939|nr:CsbD family protein [Caenibius sp. WL]QZP08954.1 CsbD family protein [Caenibius sp. WL]
MNSDTLKGNWEQVKGHIQKKWGELTNDEIDQINGIRKILTGKIQEKYGQAREEAEKEVDDFENSY